MRPGENVMEIVPIEDFVIEAKYHPRTSVLFTLIKTQRSRWMHSTTQFMEISGRLLHHADALEERASNGVLPIIN